MKVRWHLEMSKSWKFERKFIPFQTTVQFNNFLSLRLVSVLIQKMRLMLMNTSLGEGKRTIEPINFWWEPEKYGYNEFLIVGDLSKSAQSKELFWQLTLYNLTKLYCCNLQPLNHITFIGPLALDIWKYFCS